MVSIHIVSSIVSIALSPYWVLWVLDIFCIQSFITKVNFCHKFQISNIQRLSNIFLWSVACLILFSVSHRKILTLSIVQFYSFFGAFGVLSQNLLLNPRVKDFLLCVCVCFFFFPPEVFFFIFTRISMINFQLIFL